MKPTTVIALVHYAGSIGLMKGQGNCKPWWKGRTAEAKTMRRMNRVLVVEDFVPFRTLVSALLREKPNLQIVSEASDGFQAVRRARELHPDLILMDLGLPGLNGIEAARRIRTLAPRSRIVFLSQEGSAEIVEEALRSGALGYVLKPRAGDDLHPAVAAVLEGQQFVSDGLIGSKEAVITLRDVRNHRPCLPGTPYLRFLRARP